MTDLTKEQEQALVEGLDDVAWKVGEAARGLGTEPFQLDLVDPWFCLTPAGRIAAQAIKERDAAITHKHNAVKFMNARGEKYLDLHAAFEQACETVEEYKQRQDMRLVPVELEHKCETMRANRERFRNRQGE